MKHSVLQAGVALSLAASPTHRTTGQFSLSQPSSLSSRASSAQLEPRRAEGLYLSWPWRSRKSCLGKTTPGLEWTTTGRRYSR